MAQVAGGELHLVTPYFASKEDVVVQFLADMCAELASRPAGEPPSTALLRTVLVPLTTCGAHSEKVVPLVRLILRTPALRAAPSPSTLIDARRAVNHD